MRAGNQPKWVRDAIPMDALRDLDACGEVRRLLAARTDRSWSTAWRDCERGDWMLWLVGALMRRDVLSCAIPAHGAPSHRRLVGCLVDVCYALSWPWVHDREEAIWRPVEECLDTLARCADGKRVPRKTLQASRGRAWAARDAAWSRYASFDDAACTCAAVIAVAQAVSVAITVTAAGDFAAAIVADAARAAEIHCAADRAAALRCAAEIVRDWYPEAPEIGR